jgi:streptogramin lyase
MARIRLVLLAFVIMFVWVSYFPSQAAPPPNNKLMGTVNSPDGNPMEGVAVSARADGRTFTTSVYTDRKGKYFFPPLGDGHYKVWAQAIGFEAGRAELKVVAGKTIAQDFTLKTFKDFYKQLSGTEWMNSLPEDTPADRRAKAILTNNCSQCHQSGFVLQNRFDAAGWDAIVNFMSKTTPSAIIPKGGQMNPFISAYKQELVEYLSRVRGPDSYPLKYMVLPRPTGESAQVIVTEYDLYPGGSPGYMSSHNGSDWSEGIPSRYESRAAHDLTLDKEGNVWFTDNVTPKRTLGKLDPRTGHITDFMLAVEKKALANRASSAMNEEDSLAAPADGEEVAVGAHAGTTDREGNIWFTNSAEGTLTKFDPRTGRFFRFPRPSSLPRSGGFLDTDSKGNVWSVTSGLKGVGGALKLDPRTGEYAFYKSVTPGGGYYGTTVDAEDNAYFSQPGIDRVGIVDANTGKASEVAFEPKDEVQIDNKDRELASHFVGDSQTSALYMKGPKRLGGDKRGNFVWVALFYGDRLAKIDIHTKKITEYPLPHRYSQPYDAAVDKNHNVWIAVMNYDGFVKFNPNTEQFTEYPLPTRGTETRHMKVDDTTDPPTIWLAYYRTNKIARVQFRTSSTP